MAAFLLYKETMFLTTICIYFTKNPDKTPEDQSSSTVSLHQYSCPLQQKQNRIAEKVQSDLRLRSGLRRNVF